MNNNNTNNQIYVYLQNEGVDCWRPVLAKPLGNSKYRIISKNTDHKDEKWEFNTNDIVLCKEKRLKDIKEHKCLVAISKIN